MPAVADIGIALAAPVVYSASIYGASEAIASATAAPCAPVLVPAAIAVVWLVGAPMLWRASLHSAVDRIAEIRRALRQPPGSVLTAAPGTATLRVTVIGAGGAGGGGGSETFPADVRGAGGRATPSETHIDYEF